MEIKQSYVKGLKQWPQYS